MAVADDLALLASLLPPSLCARLCWHLLDINWQYIFLIRYRVQLLWATDANKDIGFKFFLCKELPSGEKDYDGDLQLRDFNLKNFNQPCSPTAIVPKAYVSTYVIYMGTGYPGISRPLNCMYI